MQDILQCYIDDLRVEQDAVVTFDLPQHLPDVGKRVNLEVSGRPLEDALDVLCIPCHSPSPDPCLPRRSRSVVQINASIRFEPPKINIFTKDCKRNGKDATCMSAFICFTAVFLSAHFQTSSVGECTAAHTAKTPNHVLFGSPALREHPASAVCIP